jgi:hypothetical protein
MAQRAAGAGTLCRQNANQARELFSAVLGGEAHDRPSHPRPRIAARCVGTRPGRPDGAFVRNQYGQRLHARPSRARGRADSDRRALQDPWREADRAAQRARRSDEQQARLDELDAIESRADAEETEYLALSWFTDHADRDRAWEWALAAARTQRPVNYVMNSQLNAAKETDPLESHVDELRGRLPPGAVIIGGAGDTRPADALRRLGGTPQLRGHHHRGRRARPVAGSTGPIRAVLRAVVKRLQPRQAPPDPLLPKQ